MQYIRSADFLQLFLSFPFLLIKEGVGFSPLTRGAGGLGGFEKAAKTS